MKKFIKTNATQVFNRFSIKIKKGSCFRRSTITNYSLINGECIEEMSKLKNESINLILTDLPYGTTQNKWDEIIPFESMWKEFNRVLKPNGIIVLTATQPFSSKLIMSNLDNFKYEIIWEKTIGSGQLNIKRQPLRVHESILIFYKKPGTYNEQKTEGNPYSISRNIVSKGEGYGKQVNSSKVNDGFRHAKSVIKISNPRIKGGHPTQKPVALMEYLIKTFSNENDMVLDCCMGSGTTGVAALNLNRKFIGIELDEKYFSMSSKRMENVNVGSK
jgi:site-specific DNA-methyltransferase (adenine-specific)